MAQQAARQAPQQAARQAPRRPHRAGWRARTCAYRPGGPGPEAVFAKSPGAPSAPGSGHCTGQGRGSSRSTAQGRAAFFQAACARVRARYREPGASTGGYRQFVRHGRLQPGLSQWAGHGLAPALVAGARLACGRLQRTGESSCLGHRGCPGCLRWGGRYACRWELAWLALAPRFAQPAGQGLPLGTGRAGRAGGPHGRNGAGLARCLRTALPCFQHGAAQRRQSLRA